VTGDGFSKRLHAADPRIVSANQMLEPAPNLGAIERVGRQQHLFDIEPILATVEYRLAHQQMLGRKERKTLTNEWLRAHPGCHRVVKAVVGKEQVDGCLPPPEPSLPVPLNQGRSVGTACDTECGERGDDPCSRLRRNKYVHVDVDSRSRDGVVGKRESATERVSYAGFIKHSMKSENLVRQSEIAQRDFLLPSDTASDSSNRS
jgi:hypothetical protein